MYYDEYLKEHNVNIDTLKKINPRGFVYHLTSPENRKSIMENGLLPMRSSGWTGVSNDYPPSIFVNNTSKSKWFNWDINKNVDVWMIYPKDNPNIWYVDFNMPEYGSDYLVTFEPIPPMKLVLIHDGVKGEKTEITQRFNSETNTYEWMYKDDVNGEWIDYSRYK